MAIQRSRNRKEVRGARPGHGPTLHRHQVRNLILPIAGWVSGIEGGLGLFCVIGGLSPGLLMEGAGASEVMAPGWGRGGRGQVGPSLNKPFRESAGEMLWASVRDWSLDTAQCSP